uniref:L-ascorbate oxidase n=2 Tax=Kalanchoe fedtschenkoi TaxID=63787 RepID=A0A7N0T6V5_KALFE
MMPLRVWGLAFLCWMVMAGEGARVRVYKWEVKYEYKSPDCYKKLAITINGRTPGPTIVAQQGDTVVVELTNSLLTENVAIHWHGIRQIGTPWSDGTEGVTQCPILPGDTFVYRFVVDRPGSYLYHAHYGMQREAGLYGAIRVSLPDGEREPYHYDYDRTIILNDWYHKSAYEQATGLSSKPFVWVGEPQSLLIHGRGRFNCSTMDAATCNATNPECAPYTLTVVPGKTYRLRVSSLTALSALSFQIEGHNMTVVEADGHNVVPFVVKNLFLYSGETYSVLVTADQDPSRNYWATSSIVGRNATFTTPPALSVINYYPNHLRRAPPTRPPAGPVWNDVAPRLSQSLAIKAREGYIHAPPAASDRVIVLLNTQNRIDGYMKWAVNNVSFTLPHTPYLIALKHRLLGAFDQTPPPENFDPAHDIYSVAKNPNATTSNGLYRLEFNSTVDIILQNANSLTPNNSETHPWHLHGHDFWVLGYGEGKFDIEKDPKSYNLVNPIMKNTVPVHPYGWTALRFRADNPGAWAFHCHIEAHFYMGMGLVFEEGIDRVGKLPSSIMGCGKTRQFTSP